jgi:hypothetical protein
MQRFVRHAAVRLAAVLVAAALGGVTPWLEAPHAEATHKCQCPKGGGHHECDCPLCHAEVARAAAAAAASREAKLPPCHLAKARKTEAAERVAAERRAASGPALSSTCGTGDHRFDPPPTVQLFTVPTAPVVPVRVTVAALVDRLDADLGVPGEPETPPPKPA